MSCSKSKDETYNIQSFARPKDARKWDPINIQVTQSVLLVLLDVTIDDSSDGNQNNIANLRDTVNKIDMFTDGEECIQFLEQMIDIKACMIISGSLSQEIVPRVHDLLQVDAIFIFCSDKANHEVWTKDWSKVKGIFTDMKPLCEALKQAAQQCDRNAISITIIGSDDSPAEQTENRLKPSFMYTQIMKEIFLTIHFEQRHMDEFIRYCREALANSEKQLKYLEEIAQKYKQHSPIWWYTRDGFLYSMLNRALRVVDANVMIKMGFFIADLHNHIKQLHEQQFGDDNANQCLTVYRGQGMDKDVFQEMKTNTGGLISFNSFLSTSKNRQVSLSFAESNAINSDHLGIFFVINIDLERSDATFASVVDVGYYGKEEDEVLFSMHTVFRIIKILPMGDNNHLVQVQLNLASDKDNDLHELINYIRKQTFPGTDGWYRLGLILPKMGEIVKAQELYEILLKGETEERGEALLYHQLGTIKAKLGKSAEATTYYEKSIEIEEKQIPRNYLNLAHCYNNIGNVHNDIGDYSKALSSYENALAIRQQVLPLTHPDLAASENNIGLVNSNMGNYPKALSSHKKALAIRQQSLPPAHPDLAASENNIGNVYYGMGDYSQALSSYKRALTIQQQSLPPAHPDLVASYNNISMLYNRMGDYSNALWFHEKVLAIRQQSLTCADSDLAASYGNIGNVHFNMGNYPNAFSFYDRALTIQQQSLPSAHSDLAASYNNIGNVYCTMGEHAKALSSHEKAVAIRQQSLPPTHPDMALSYNNIGMVYYSMSNYPEALSSHEKAVAIRQQSLPPTHPDMALSYNNIGMVYHNMGDYSKAFLAYEEALVIQKQACDRKGRDFAATYNMMGLLHENTGNCWKAHCYYEHAVDLAHCSLPTDHPDLLRWKYNLDRVQQKFQ